MRSELRNVVDNTNGTIIYVAGVPLPVNTSDPVAVSDDFDFAVITFKANESSTPPSSPTEVVFLVKNGDHTQASTSGAALLSTTKDYTGAFISIVEG